MQTYDRPPKPSGALDVRVRSITYLGEDINAYDVVPVDHPSLPPFTAGAHVDLYFRDGRVRQYSLCSDPARTDGYTFAVQREENGRGGSRAIFELVHPGRILAISPPRNNFPLNEEAPHHVLIAGGIGITPIMSMVRRLGAIDASFELHYAVRKREKLAFSEDLRTLVPPERLFIYIDGGDVERGMRVEAVVSGAAPGSHFYCCGPAGLMRAVKRATGGLPPERIHFEHFTAPTPAKAVPSELLGESCDTIGVGFRVRLARSGGTFDVPDDKSIVEVLRENGLDVATSCESGLCGTCRTRYLEGEPEHRDYVLDDEARRHDVLICCARSKSPVLVLDL